MSIFSNWKKKDKSNEQKNAADTFKENNGKGILSPGRVSVANDSISNTILGSLTGSINLITPSFRSELIPLIRKLYKVNPDMSIAVQDMFKLTNSGHTILFPQNSDAESKAMVNHLESVTKNWSRYTAGIDGLVNKFIVQCLIGGAISVEAVPNNSLTSISTILFINPEDVMFERLADGVYHPYQVNRAGLVNGKTEPYIKLNPETYKYVSMFNDTDEPYGIPPLLASLDSLKTQSDMKVSIKQIMEMMGLMGFLEVTMAKPDKRANESDPAYERRLTNLLVNLKKNLKQGLKDGVVTGYIDDHEFKLNSTTKTMGNVDKMWGLNQQSVANGLGVSGTILGISSSSTEGGAGIVLSKMISQLRNIQMMVTDILEFIYTLELRLAGFNNKGISIQFTSSTVSDELKIQQALEYKVRNLTALYNQGIISQDGFAVEMGYKSPAMKKPRVVTNPDSANPLDPASAQKKQVRKKDKTASDKKTRDKNKTVPKRKDQKN